MQTINDLDLNAKDKAKVRAWLTKIAKHFEKISDGERETVERYNIDNLDFFYFTDCRDILSKNVKSKGVEDADAIRKRKKAVEYKMLFQTLLGKKFGRKRPCSHCGNDDRIIDSLKDGTGHFLCCPKCFMTTIVTYPVGYNTCIKQMYKVLKYKYGLDPFKIIEEKIANDEELDEELGEEKKHKCCGKCKK